MFVALCTPCQAPRFPIFQRAPAATGTLKTITGGGMKDIAGSIALVGALAWWCAADALSNDLDPPEGCRRCGTVEEVRREAGDREAEGRQPLETRTYRQGGVVITVRLMERERDAVDFELDIENTGAVRKNLRARLCLFDLRVRDRDCGSGEVPVTVDVREKSRVALKARVRPTSIWEAWTLVIVKVQ